MKLVPTTASAEIAAAAIREHYAGLVQPRLLDAWAAAPADAPGRPVSSPWPDRIEVQLVSRAHGGAVVSGTLVEETSTGVARRVPVRLHLEPEGDSWLISSYEIRAGETAADPQAAVTILRDYYRAISSGDYRKAYASWGPSGPPGQTFENFAEGFANTASVDVTTGAPSRVEPAAGSRYVTVPVTIVARTKSGATERFEGTYTLRRSVVDGASEAQRRWHLYRAAIKPAKPG